MISEPQKNAWYPAHESERADELISELDKAQLLELYEALQSQTLVEWWEWIEEKRADISEYDYLSRTERRKLLKHEGSATLMLHHACIYIELWRSRTVKRYFSFPPSGVPIDTPVAQREMMLAVVASYQDFDMRDIWPFEVLYGKNNYPFHD
jgi:hypothetical protein